jgi:hypothetical protein
VQEVVVTISAPRVARRQASVVLERRVEAPVSTGPLVDQRLEQAVAYRSSGHDRRPPTQALAKQLYDFDVRDRVAWDVWQEIVNRQFRALLVEDLRMQRLSALRQLPRWKRLFYELFGIEPKLQPDAPTTARPRGASVQRELVLPEYLQQTASN